jgi:hypothetical protein
MGHLIQVAQINLTIHYGKQAFHNAEWGRLLESNQYGKLSIQAELGTPLFNP